MDGPIMELDLICSRFRAIPTPVICDAMYEIGIPEQTLCIPKIAIKDHTLAPLSFGGISGEFTKVSDSAIRVY